MGAVCFCPCPQPGSQGSHSVGSVCSATANGGDGQKHSKTSICKCFVFAVDCIVVM